MAKAVGLDAGEYEIKLVELEGSYRRTRLSKIAVERVEQDEAGADDALHASREAESALQAFKTAEAHRENYGFALYLDGYGRVALANLVDDARLLDGLHARIGDQLHAVATQFVENAPAARMSHFQAEFGPLL